MKFLVLSSNKKKWCFQARADLRGCLGKADACFCLDGVFTVRLYVLLNSQHEDVHAGL